MGYLNAAAIEAADDRKTVDFEVPEWGGTVRLMVLSGSDIDKLERIQLDPEKVTDGIRAQLVGMCMVDESNKRLFTDADLRLLGKKNGQVLSKVFKKCLEINKVEDEDAEEAVLDFEDAPAEPSTTD